MSKINDVRWYCYQDDETGKIEFWEYRLRSIRKNNAYWILKNFVTWDKLSTKHFNYGWIDPIPN